jgi:diacylglycerol kinase (ATP)
MSSNKPFKISERIKSFGYALEGIVAFFKTQHNAWIHLFAAIVVVVLGFVLKVNSNEWCWLIVAITLVLITEMLNTAIEFLCDFVSPQLHPQIKNIKDIAAGAVLIAAFGAIAIGCVVFLPKVL